MSSAWRKTLVYLGLVEEPEEHDELPQRFDDRRRAPEQPSRAEPDPVRPLRLQEPGSPHVRAMQPDAATRTAVVDVASFDDCERIGTRYRSGNPVVFDLSEVDRDLGRRVLDFVSGVTFALRGSLTKVGSRAFLLVPDGVEISAEDRRRLESLGFRSAP